MRPCARRSWGRSSRGGGSLIRQLQPATSVKRIAARRRSTVDCANAAVFKRSIERILSDEGRSRDINQRRAAPGFISEGSRCQAALSFPPRERRRSRLYRPASALIAVGESNGASASLVRSF